MNKYTVDKANDFLIVTNKLTRENILSEIHALDDKNMLLFLETLIFCNYQRSISLNDNLIKLFTDIKKNRPHFNFLSIYFSLLDQSDYNQIKKDEQYFTTLKWLREQSIFEPGLLNLNIHIKPYSNDIIEALIPIYYENTDDFLASLLFEHDEKSIKNTSDSRFTSTKQALNYRILLSFINGFKKNDLNLHKLTTTENGDVFKRINLTFNKIYENIFSEPLKKINPLNDFFNPDININNHKNFFIFLYFLKSSGIDFLNFKQNLLDAKDSNQIKEIFFTGIILNIDHILYKKQNTFISTFLNTNTDFLFEILKTSLKEVDFSKIIKRISSPETLALIDKIQIDAEIDGSTKQIKTKKQHKI